MSHRLSRLGRAVFALACTATLLIPGAARAASPARYVQYDVPSLQGNVIPSKVQFNGTDKLTAWVRLPAGYDEQPDRKWPVLYLLHGWEDNSYGWIDPKKGSLATTIPADFEGIVVMTEGAKDWFINWADPKGNPGHQWGNYLYDEVVPFMESHLRIMPGRANHAIGGLSMGGYGALRAVAAFPTYFGHALSFSGLLNNQDASFVNILNIAQFTHPGYGSVFGSLTGPYATTMNPLKYPRDLAQSDLSIYYGTPAVSVLWSLDLRVRGEATLEVGAQLEARDFLAAIKPTGASVYSQNLNNGSHTWIWWNKYLADAVKRGLFSAPPVTQTSDAKNWDYDTMAQHGNAWGIGYTLLLPATRTVTLSRRGQQLSGAGTGVITIRPGAADDDSSGNGSRLDCTFAVQLPFTRTLPAGC